MYADDTQLYLPFHPNKYQDAIHQMENCLEDTKDWMAKNHLKLNEEKTEFVVIGHKYTLQNIPGPHQIKIGSETITATEKAKNIGAVMDSQLTMVQHVNHLSKGCYVHLRNIGKIRPNLTEEAASTLVHSFISSRIDNGNSLLYGISDKVVHKLQLIQNHAARIVTRSKKHDHVTPLLKRLHWLPVKYRIHYKLCLLTFKCLHGKAPAYLSGLLCPYVPSRTLRSGGQGLLKVKTARLKTVGDRAFQVAAPKLWNKLPEALRQCTELEAFKAALKTHLFRMAYDD